MRGDVDDGHEQRSRRHDRWSWDRNRDDLPPTPSHRLPAILVLGGTSQVAGAGRNARSGGGAIEGRQRSSIARTRGIANAKRNTASIRIAQLGDQMQWPFARIVGISHLDMLIGPLLARQTKKVLAAFTRHRNPREHNGSLAKSAGRHGW